MDITQTNKLSLLCITEPSSHPPKDTTVDLYRAFAAHPDVVLFHTSPDQVFNDEGPMVVQIDFSPEYEEFLRLNDSLSQKSSFANFDVIFCRTDLPYPAGYLDALSKYESDTCFVNKPSRWHEVHSPEFIQQFLQPYMPDGIFSNVHSEIERFLSNHPVAVAKQANSYGGKGVFKIISEGSSVSWDNVTHGQYTFSSRSALIDALLKIDGSKWEFVEFLINVDKGDKRVLVVDGDIYGALLRLSADSWVHNITSGAQTIAADVHDREREIVEQTCQHFHERGIATLGYDFLIGNDGLPVLSEINAGNVGGYAHLDRVSDAGAVKKLISWILTLR